MGCIGWIGLVKAIYNIILVAYHGTKFIIQFLNIQESWKYQSAKVMDSHQEND